MSVLVPARNAQDVIGRSLSSVRAQTFADWEAIVVDDGSSDATSRLAHGQARHDPRIKLIANSEGPGAANARNAGLKVARGRYIAFLDADDAWHPDKLARQLAHMSRNDAVLGYTGFMRTNGSMSRQVNIPPTVSYEQLLRGNCIGCLTAMYDRAAVGSMPMPHMKTRHDYALWLDILAQGQVAHGLDEPLATYHITPKSLSANKLSATLATWRMYHTHIGLSALRSTGLVLSHVLRRLWRG